MEMQTIKQSIDINAPGQKVWEVLINDETLRIWCSVFGEGMHAATDWKEGSKVLFIDKTSSGLAGEIAVNNPGRELKIEYTGMVTDGVEDHDSPVAQAVKGGIERYVLTTNSGITSLDISCDMSTEYYEHMYKLWELALQKIKELAEG